MKKNWWKLLVVAALIAAVAVVVSGKNKAPQMAAVETVETEMASAAVDTAAEEKAEAPAAVTDKPEQEAKDSEKQAGPEAKAEPAAVKKEKAADDKQPQAKPVTEAAVKPKSDPKPAQAAKVPEAPRRLPKMLELGSEKCTPCKMMKPIIEELQKEYKGKIEIEVIDVWKDSSYLDKYDIQSIPTQIFLDENGKEFFRHVGFYPKEDILKVFRDKGYNLD